MFKLRKITDRISYLPASENPLSADVVIVKGDKTTYFFDVGSCDDAYKLIKNTTGRKCIILSHFHHDHTGNIERIFEENKMSNDSNEKDLFDIYLSRETYNHINKFIGNASVHIIGEPVSIDDGVCIEINRLPSSHCKGTLCACIDNEYVMLGDGTYMANIKGRQAYNVQFLKEEIDFLKKLQFRYTLLSHDEGFVHDRQEIIDNLEKYYGFREKSNPYITMPYTKNS